VKILVINLIGIERINMELRVTDEDIEEIYR
jgi:hypothetical protein